MAEEKAGTFERVLGASKKCGPLEERAFGVCGDENFYGALGAHLGEFFRDAGECLREHHVSDGGPLGPGGIEQGQKAEGENLESESDDQCETQAEVRSEPAAEEVGDDAEEFVQEKKERERDGAVAEVEEMQQH